ncbi:unnamed protein product, partial [Ectocarpus sp. 13 AM-2016]
EKGVPVFLLLIVVPLADTTNNRGRTQQSHIKSASPGGMCCATHDSFVVVPSSGQGCVHQCITESTSTYLLSQYRERKDPPVYKYIKGGAGDTADAPENLRCRNPEKKCNDQERISWTCASTRP